MSLYNDIVYWLTIKPRLARLKRLLPQAFIHPTGSRYICSPPVLGTDIDFLVYCEGRLDKQLILAGYKLTDFASYGQPLNPIVEDQFQAWRKGAVNLIVTQQWDYAASFLAATLVCKEQNYWEKGSRVYVHESFRGNVTWELLSAYGLGEPVENLIRAFNGPHRTAMLKTFLIQRGISLTVQP